MPPVPELQQIMLAGVGDDGTSDGERAELPVRRANNENGRNCPPE